MQQAFMRHPAALKRRTTMNDKLRKRKRKQLKHAEMTQSTAVIQCKKDGLELGGAVAALTEGGAAALEVRLAPVLVEGERMPDVRLLFRLLGRLAEREVEALDEADAQRWVAGLELLSLRQSLHQAKDELRATTVRVRKILVELFGAAYSRFRFGLSKRTPRGTADLALEAGRIERRLRTGTAELPQSSAPGLTIKPLAWAEALRPGVVLVERLLREVEAARIRLSDLAGERERRLESCRATYLQVAHVVETLFVLAGEPEYARSVRSSARWRQRVAEARRQRRPRVVRMAKSSVGRLRSAVVTVADWLGRKGQPSIASASPGWLETGDPAVASTAAVAENR
jgi:hypothetical protein